MIKFPEANVLVGRFSNDPQMRFLRTGGIGHVPYLNLRPMLQPSERNGLGQRPGFAELRVVLEPLEGSLPVPRCLSYALTPGADELIIVTSDISGEPNTDSMTAIAAPLSTQWAHGYSGCSGVLSIGCQVASGSVAGLSSICHLIDQCLEQIERTGWQERWPLAEVLRLKGWILMRQGRVEEAEAQLRASIAWASQQQAKSWELHSSTTLAELLAQRGRRDAARELLAPIYNWFTEGFHTKDLKEAKALLGELA